MGLKSRLVVSAVAELTSALDLAAGSVPLNLTKNFELANGTGADQADRIWHDQRTLNASTNEDLDLAGVLVDAFGATFTLARVRALIVAAALSNVNNVVVGAAAVNPWSTLLGATGTLQVRPGGIVAAIARDTTGYAVTAATADLLRVANGGAGSAVTYDIVVIGASA